MTVKCYKNQNHNFFTILNLQINSYYSNKQTDIYCFPEINIIQKPLIL
jgi:hypothetical protein